jgi:serine/threonine-protein kinase
MGRVYQVLDKDLNRNVAMKVLSGGKIDRDSEFRFVAEAQISGQLEHPALLPIHDIGIDGDGRSFFTMRYVPEHETLEDVIELLKAGNQEAHEIYTMKRRVQIIQRVCDALTYAHLRGVVHRDIKPSNILIGSTGEIYLADWGVACLLAQESDDSVDTNLTDGPDDEGKLIGTPLYMSPEQLMANGAITAKSDVYSLCAVAYELFTLAHYLGPNPPVSALTIYETITECPRIDAEHYLHPVGGRVPRQISRVLRHGLQHNRADAIDTAAELEAALQRWVEGTAPIVCPGTFLQSWLGRTSRAIDRRPVAFPIVLIAVFGILVASIATTALTIMNRLG